MRVAVVGAGFAGLMAATRLMGQGHDVVVLEARDRVGGRVWSQELMPGDPRTVIERGAEFILDGYDVMRGLLADLGLELAAMGISYGERTHLGPNGPAIAAAVRTALDAVSSAAHRAPSGTSLAEVVADLTAASGVDAAALEAAVSRLAVTSGAEPAVLDAMVAADLTAGAGSSASHRVAGGNQRLALGLCDRLGDSLRLRTPVRAVDQHDGGVRVLTDVGEVSADAVVVAVPLTQLARIEFRPGLPDRTTAAIARTGVGHNAKLHVPLTETPELSAVQCVSDRFWTWTATDDSGLVQPVVHAFAGTPSGLDQLRVAAGPQRWAARLAALRPDLALAVDQAVLTTWNDDPWAGLSYSALTLDTRPEDSATMAEPVGRIHFAGEHTAGDWAGLMEGALRTGARAAAEVERAAATKERP